MRLSEEQLKVHLQMDEELREIWRRFDLGEVASSDVYDAIIRDLEWTDSLPRWESRIVDRRRWAYDLCSSLYHWLLWFLC